jgi:hypothetical protein
MHRWLRPAERRGLEFKLDTRSAAPNRPGR